MDQLRADAFAGVGHHALATGWIGTPPHDLTPAAEPPAEDDDAGGPTAPGPAREPVAQEPVPAAPPSCAGTGFGLGQVGGHAARIQVSVPLSVLTGTGDEHAGQAAHTRWDPTSTTDIPPPELAEVAVLHGYGPITPDIARALALTGTWQRLVTDPFTGTVLDIGRRRYTPPADLADLIRARDRTCVRPGCTVPADRCDLDHTTPYHHGGTTSAANLGALCPTDHTHKSQGTYRLEQPRPGVFDFHLPSGHSYRRHPDGTTTTVTPDHPTCGRSGRPREGDDNRGSHTGTPGPPPY